MILLGSARTATDDHMEEAILTEARAICSRRAGRPATDLWSLRGLLALKQQDWHLGIAYLTQALAVKGLTPELFAALGDALSRVSRPDDAVSACLRAVALGRTDPHVWRDAGLVFAQAGHPSIAIICLSESARLAPDSAKVHCLLGDAHRNLGDPHKALRCYEFATCLAPHDVDCLAHLGWELMRRSEWRRAAAIFQDAVGRDRSRADLRAALGSSLVELHSLYDALRQFHAALRIEPRNLDACRGLVRVLDALGLIQEASSARLHLASVLRNAGRLIDAAAVCTKAVADQPKCLGALVTLGTVLLELGQPELAIEPLQRAVAVDPESYQPHLQLSRAHHLTGDHDRGWEEFAWWYHPRTLKIRLFEQPVWDGSPLEGQTILLWSRTNHGLGDDVQFLRYAQQPKQLGARVIIETPASLASLVEQADGVDEVVTRGGPLPHFDVHAPLGLIPVIRKAHIPVFAGLVPYIRVEEAARAKWRRRLQSDARLTVGICWAGRRGRPDARVRFASLAHFARLAQVEGIRFVSLQLGPQSSELLTTSPRFRVEAYLSEGGAVADTAALVANLDLVVTVDTMIAHLAGALAVPVWTLLPHAADWRWLRGERSPWYPTMRLFRQSQSDNWNDLFHRVALALEHVRDGLRAPTPHGGSAVPEVRGSDGF